MAQSHEHARTADDVQQEIAQTRAELDDTLDDIGRRLSPRAIKARAADSIKDVMTDVPATLQRHPTPAVLAVGAAVLGMLLRRRARLRRERAQLALALWSRFASMPSHTGGAANALSTAVAQAGSLAHGAGESVAHLVGDAAARAQRALASDGAAPIVEPAKRALKAAEHASQEHPLAALASAVLCGALLTQLLRR